MVRSELRGGGCTTLLLLPGRGRARRNMNPGRRRGSPPASRGRARLTLEIDPRADAPFGIQPVAELVETHGRVLQRLHSRSVKRLACKRPRPSINHSAVKVMDAATRDLKQVRTTVR